MVVLIKKVEQKVCVEREEFGEEVIGQKSLAIYILFGGVFFVFFGQRFFLDQLKSLRVELKTTFELLTYFIPIINIVDHVLIVIE